MRISDWSSDLCSSDLRGAGIAAEHDAAPLVIEAIADRRLDRAVIDWKGGDRQPVRPIDGRRPGRHRKGQGDRARGLRRRDGRAVMSGALAIVGGIGGVSSGERRVGEECDSTCRTRWSPYTLKKK